MVACSQRTWISCWDEPAMWSDWLDPAKPPPCVVNRSTLAVGNSPPPPAAFVMRGTDD